MGPYQALFESIRARYLQTQGLLWMVNRAQRAPRRRGGAATDMKPRRAAGFYDTPAWKAARRAALERDGYRCVVCGADIRGRGQSRVDHIKPLRTYPHLGLTLSNLRSLCATHDNQGHREKGRQAPAAGREERFVIAGCDSNGQPLDPAHHWRRRLPGQP